jgi:hypothetical protein
LAAYGISKIDEKAIDTSHDLDEHFLSLNPHLKLQPPVGAGFKDCLEHLFAQALEHQYPDHPRFEGEVKRVGLRRGLEVVRRAAQIKDGRVESATDPFGGIRYSSGCGGSLQDCGASFALLLAIQASEAKQVFAEIESDLAAQTGTTLEVDWKIYR